MKHLITLAFLMITLNFSANAQLFGRTYSLGYYYNKNGEKISGLVNAKPDYQSKIYFKKDDDAKVEKINFEDFTSVVVFKGTKTDYRGKDSLCVKSSGKPGKGLYLAILATPEAPHKLYYKTLPERASAPTMTVGASPVAGSRGSQPAFTNNIGWKSGGFTPGSQKIMYEEDNDVTIEITIRNYKKLLAEAFADKPIIVEQIAKTKFKDVHLLIVDYNTVVKTD